MSHPSPSIAVRPLSRLVLAMLLVFEAACGLAATRPPDARIPLDSLGYVALSKQVLSSGAAILTINYVDDRHLLVTFSVRRLLKRIPDDPPEDTDRSIDAVLVDLPSGSVLARTAWRLHDPAQYLWPLGNGRFLLRVRDRLTTFSPLQNLKSGDPFKEFPFLSSPRPIGAVLLSPDVSLLILETIDHLKPAQERSPSPGTRAYAAAQAQANQAGSAAGSGAPDEPKLQHREPARNPVEIHFYRIRPNAEGELFAQSSGALSARNLVSIPADGAGFLSILDEGRQHWAFNFNLYRGRTEELSPFDSTCHPRPILVSRSEFIAFGCRSGNERQMFGGFNFRGEEMWEQAIPETYLNPTFAFAPTAGRFAFGRVNTASVAGDPVTLSPDNLTAQIVSVFQTDSGKIIFHEECTPILPAGQNFDLSPDGNSLAILHDSVIEIHQLPALSAKDRAGVAKAAALAPELSEGPVLLSAPLSNATARAATKAGSPVPSPPTDPLTNRPSAIVDSDTIAPSAEPEAAPAGQPAVPAAVAAAPPRPETRQIENGDPAPSTDGPRKPPTLYNPSEQSDPSTDAAKPK